MNYLAHLLLAGPGDDARLGSLLGDFVRPAETAAFDAVVAREIRLHRFVDSYTDAHPTVLACKARFRPATRRFAGIVLDVYFDHALSTHWTRFCRRPRPEFIAEAYAGLAAQARAAPVPERFAAALPWMIAQDWLGSYATLDGVALTLDRIARRLPKGGDALRAGVDDVHLHRDALDAAFLDFFPQLAVEVVARRGAAGPERTEHGPGRYHPPSDPGTPA